ncbi:MAG: hypothetical protein FWD62_01945 [Betaproteobacteria bacterium]|nr:hypothetical protein [Betaproteobacteria bacterium]
MSQAKIFYFTKTLLALNLRAPQTKSNKEFLFMATEDNKFDTYLKEKLYRDLIFRAAVSIAISAIASYYAIHVEGINALEFMKGATTRIMWMLNSLGVFSIFLAVVALTFKDLESSDGKIWGQNTKKGCFGAGVRRLAGDLTTWVFGTIFAIVTVTFVAVFWGDGLLEKALLISFLGLALFPWAVVMGFINILVRQKEGALLSRKLKKSYQLILIYSAVLVIMVLGVFPKII